MPIMPAEMGSRVHQAYHRYDGEAKLLLVTLGIIFAAGAVIAHYLGAGTVGVGLLFGASGLSVVCAIALSSIKTSPQIPRRKGRVDSRPVTNSAVRTHSGIIDPKVDPKVDPEESAVRADSGIIDSEEAAEHAQKKRKPLLVYAFRGNLQGVKTWVDMNSDVNERDADRNTSLHLAVMNGHVDVVKVLVNVRGIKLQARNKKHQTPYDLARHRAQYAKSSDPRRETYIRIIEMLAPPTSSKGEKEE